MKCATYLGLPNSLFYPPTYKTADTVGTSNILYRDCTHNRLPEDEPSGSKHVKDVIN
jgi:hypothetical protein